MTTTLIDRYLRAVREQLPRGQQDDIIGELSEDLRSQVEDREAELGRPRSRTASRPPSCGDSATR